MNPWLLLVPFITAISCWATIWMAIAMLFHPQKPVFIAGIKVQGIIPKQQKAFAERLANIVSEELLSIDDFGKKIYSTTSIEKISPVIDQHLDDFLRNKLGKSMPMIAMFIGDRTITQLKAVFMQELVELFPTIMQHYMRELQQEPDLRKMLTDWISTFLTTKLESVLYPALSKEFRLAGFFGAMIGLLAGVVQLLIILFVH